MDLSDLIRKNITDAIENYQKVLIDLNKILASDFQNISHDQLLGSVVQMSQILEGNSRKTVGDVSLIVLVMPIFTEAKEKKEV